MTSVLLVRARLRQLAGLVLCLALTRCAVPGGHVEQHGPSFVPWADPIQGQPSTGQVYFYRQGGWYGLVITMIIKNGDHVLGELPGGYVKSVTLPAGDYIFTVVSNLPLTFGHATIPVRVKPGSRTYVDVVLQGSEVPAGHIVIPFAGGRRPVDQSGAHDCSSDACIYVVPEAEARDEMKGLNYLGQILP